MREIDRERDRHTHTHTQRYIYREREREREREGDQYCDSPENLCGSRPPCLDNSHG